MKIDIVKINARQRKIVRPLLISTNLGREIAGPAKQFWVAKAGKKVVGCACLDFELIQDGVAIFRHFAVHEELRKQGIGSLLLTEAIRSARVVGVETIAFVTMYYRFNFFKKRGFKTVPRANLPEFLRNYPLFTAKEYKKCAVMVGDIQKAPS